MIIENKEYAEILITDKDGRLVVSITDKDIVIDKGYEISLLPA